MPKLLVDRLYRIRTKTMVVCGESDRMIPPPHREAFRQGIISAELIRVPSARYMVILERPEAGVAAVARPD